MVIYKIWNFALKSTSSTFHLEFIDQKFDVSTTLLFFNFFGSQISLIKFEFPSTKKLRRRFLVQTFAPNLTP